ncbi:iron uptake transporter deferrochelatase/peroxidase subunit [Amnibacterium kyonggiense]|uniref:Deferrochelatase n=1 Tax=Amnibacterium kyonggiense TaxID=595671 RepID=A0A4R7FHW2_9MICO|nr:iron uptake transporter deferrochelatase/peroxidase subunit [Amnibacterium kyonggiense]TDS75994.1 deferrochelatase/peroxidase EfeB [Amnibacterium kyonggiense]
MTDDDVQGARPPVSRRGLISGIAGGFAAGAVAGAGGAAAFAAAAAPASAPEDESETVDLTRSHPFYGQAHQAGIQTEQQRYTVYMTFDLTSPLASDLQVLLARWSGAIAQMMQGLPIGSVEPDGSGAVALDTGEAYELSPASLTVTVGLGPGVFDDRFGLAAKRPKHLADLPDLPSDQLQDETSGGDLSLQACADDPQVAYHAIRDLTRMARGVATTRWTVLGFGRASAGKGQKTPRNLMGFKDGTRNIKEESDFDRFVWVGDDQAWTRGGSYQVVRKIQMNIETWDADPVGDQQDVFGRTKAVGAPLTGEREFDVPDFAKRSGDATVIPQTSHVALAAHENNGGVKILRRGYNYTDGLNRVGLLDAGLLFLSYQNDPQHFITLQTRLGSVDRLNEYIQHIGSAIFFTPRSPKRGRYIGQELFE